MRADPSFPAWPDVDILETDASRSKFPAYLDASSMRADPGFQAWPDASTPKTDAADPKFSGVTRYTHGRSVGQPIPVIGVTGENVSSLDALTIQCHTSGGRSTCHPMSETINPGKWTFGL
jgi:hypothetical protein